MSLRGEGFVDLIDVNVLGGQTSLLKGFRDSVSGTNTHNLRGDTSDCVRDKFGEDGETKLLGNRSSSQEDTSGTFSDLGGVTSGGGTFLLESGLELRERLEGGFLADSVVLGDGDFLFVAVLILNGGLDVDDFLIEETSRLSDVCTTVRFNGESVLGLTSDLVSLSNVFGGDTHGDDALSSLLVFEDGIGNLLRVD